MIVQSHLSGSKSQHRGRPLLMLAILLSCWAGMRATFWEPPFPADGMAENLLADSYDAKVPKDGRSAKWPNTASAGNLAAEAQFEASPQAQPTLPPFADQSGVMLAPDALPAPWAQIIDLPPTDTVTRPSAPIAEKAPRTAAAHQLMFLAALSKLPVPDFLAQSVVASAGPDTSAATVTVPARADRWSLDTWLFWREGSDRTLAAAGRVPSYGASQTAGVLRYRIAPNNRHDPRAYFRAYRALIDDGEGELASGVSARPVAQIPARTHFELRATRFENDWEIRPAAFATTELAPLDLPGKASAEIYLQGGYVGGKNNTAFADGQVHVLREVANFDLGRMSLGGALWGGAQEGAERLDIGPSARLDLKIGSAPARVSLDWRERVAGEAMPNSGAALTLSARF